MKSVDDSVAVGTFGVPPKGYLVNGYPVFPRNPMKRGTRIPDHTAGDLQASVTFRVPGLNLTGKP